MLWVLYYEGVTINEKSVQLYPNISTYIQKGVQLYPLGLLYCVSTSGYTPRFTYFYVT